jgi:hypothetical protein
VCRVVVLVEVGVAFGELGEASPPPTHESDPSESVIWSADFWTALLTLS